MLLMNAPIKNIGNISQILNDSATFLYNIKRNSDFKR